MYKAVLIYSGESEFIGYGIKEEGAIKLKGPNIWTEEEKEKLIDELGKLNQSSAIMSSWPDANDPEVRVILNDPTFMPLERAMQEVVDEENSYYVYTQEPEYDREGIATGNYVDGKVDQAASVIATKMAEVLVRPSDVTLRTKKACEIVAQRRAGLT